MDHIRCLWLEEAFHLLDKRHTFFDDFPHLIYVKMSQWVVIGLLTILEKPVVVLSPPRVDLFGSDKVPMQR